MSAADWFEVRKVSPDLWMIVEPQHVVSWLYIGSERAALIDTGTGIMPIRPIVEAITDKPVVAINTHYHFDHIGCNGAFPDRLASVKAGPLLRLPSSRNLLDRYLRGFAGVIAEAQTRRMTTPDAYALTPESEPRDFPAAFDGAAWSPGSVPATGLLVEGDEIDLGDRRLRVIDTPGHSPDGISLFDAERGRLFVGDTLTEGSLYAHYDESSTEALLDSVGKLARLEAPVHVICAGHVPRAVAEISLIDDTAAALTRVLDGTASLQDGTDVFGYPLKEARIGRIWITQSLGAATSYTLYDGESGDAF
jgi:glyoxylase-like metal-dependent hydrolase (beta-lactamase superfamily II)